MPAPRVAEVLAKYESQITAWFCRRVADGEVEDLVQDAACAIIEAYPRFRGDSSVRTWVFAICRNVLYRYYRACRRRPCRLDPDCLATTPDDRSARIALSAVAGSLPPRLKSVYELRLEQGLPVRDIAQWLGKPEGTVKYQLYEIRAHLRRYLDPEDLLGR